MRRKVIQIAGSTCLISLPKKWAELNGVKKGDELTITEQGSRIVVSKDNEANQKSIKISLEKFGVFHPHLLSAAYHMGYEDVEIRYVDPETLNKVQERIPNCIGYEIINQGDNFCVIKSISQLSADEFDQILRKIFLLLLSMGKNMTEILEANEFKKLKSVKILEITNNKLTDYCKRVLNIAGYKHHDKLTIVYLIVTYLEMVADQFRDICDFLMEKKGKLDPVDLGMFKECVELFNLFYISYYKFSAANTESVFKLEKSLKKNILERLKKTRGESVLLCHALKSITTLIYEMENTNIEMNM